MRPIIVLVVILVGLFAGVFLLGGDDRGAIRSSVALSTAMGGDTTGYARATEVRPLSFPDDYGPHPEFKTEWWYYTGNLETVSGRRFGYEFTIFRSALTPEGTAAIQERSTDWASNQLFMGHFALVDVEAGEFYAFERFSRGAAGLAGAESPPYRVWLEDWSVESTGLSTDSLFPKRLRAAEDEIKLELSLTSEKPVVLQGDRGLDPKGPGVGNASYYYSFTRLAASGTVSIAGETFEVSGSSWKDHEWSTSALSKDQVGWDWFALQLSDGTDIMFYQLRRTDGSPSPFTNGIWVGLDGSTQPITLQDVELDVLDTWTSPHSGAEYPSGWSFRIPARGLDLRVDPLVRDQELNVSVRYWEGAVDVTGSLEGKPISGRGYVELTGYGDTESTEVKERGGDQRGATRAAPSLP